MIELRNITKRFGNVLANDNVNIVVKPGSISIVGKWRGKPRRAYRVWIYKADEGEILIDAMSQHRVASRCYCVRDRLVHQLSSVDTMTVAENSCSG